MNAAFHMLSNSLLNDTTIICHIYRTRVTERNGQYTIHKYENYKEHRYMKMFITKHRSHLVLFTSVGGRGGGH